ncbi:hypothetical protein [Cupriavidus plantarum]|uniref:hypothetical protein n=3 Tax=Cupriavidus plantarum TaxID=942865 RepID=UPI000E262903|nr:hypothetical protein [Cupriavidus plantarum]REE91209.1 hypothetical protein C7418_4512 [Cupriavidus plantarum]
MKRMLATTALAVSTLFCLPAIAQQTAQQTAPTSPMPSNPPVEGPNANRGTNAGVPGNQNDSTNMTTQSQRDAHGKSKNTGARAKKPRQQDAAPYSTADAPSGPKGDSPDPAPNNNKR